jgi:hypothetical protein
MSRLYVYALMDSPPPRLRVGDRSIEGVAFGDVYAAAVRGDELPRVSELALEEQHAIVGRLAARTAAILPMRFGALIDERELDRILTTNHAAIRAALDLVRGREQMTARLIGPAPVRAAAAPVAVTSGTEYLRRRRDATRPRSLPEGAALVQDAVRSMIAAERVEAGDGNVRATLWHLIERGQAARYRETVKPVAPRTSPLRLVVTGPWPPFAFAPELLS